jgi:hypothetical protein
MPGWHQGSGIATASDSQCSEVMSARLRGRTFFLPRFALMRLVHERLALTSLLILLPFAISARRRS